MKLPNLKLPPSLAKAGDRLLHLASTPSTMDEARALAQEHRGNRLWIVADEQTGGRGRQGRAWQSPPGNLYMTLVLPAPCPLRLQPQLGFVAGVALCKAVRSLMADGESVRLKWPNDLLANDAKVSGLLLEGLEQGSAVAIGIGVNIAAFPDNMPYAATALNLTTKKSEHASLTPPDLFERLSGALVEELGVFGDGSGFPVIRQRWLGMAAHLNKRILVRTSGQPLEGVFKDIDETGRLLLETAAGVTRIDAGDVFPLDK